MNCPACCARIECYFNLSGIPTFYLLFKLRICNSSNRQDEHFMLKISYADAGIFEIFRFNFNLSLE